MCQPIPSSTHWPCNLAVPLWLLFSYRHGSLECSWHSVFLFFFFSFWNFVCAKMQKKKKKFASILCYFLQIVSLKLGPAEVRPGVSEATVTPTHYTRLIKCAIFLVITNFQKQWSFTVIHKEAPGARNDIEIKLSMWKHYVLVFQSLCIYASGSGDNIAIKTCPTKAGSSLCFYLGGWGPCKSWLLQDSEADSCWLALELRSFLCFHCHCQIPAVPDRDSPACLCQWVFEIKNLENGAVNAWSGGFSLGCLMGKTQHNLPGAAQHRTRI